jgi:hypothetical protein
LHFDLDERGNIVNRDCTEVVRSYRLLPKTKLPPGFEEFR